MTREPWFAAAAGVAAAFLVVLYHSGVDFPLGLHPDEPGKIQQVLHGGRDYHHPLLLLHLLTALGWLTEALTPEELIRVGRTAMAVAGGVTVLATYGLARMAMPAMWSLWAALFTGATVLLGVHAQFVKEDILLTPLVLLALALLIRCDGGERPHTTSKWLAAGAALGAAVSAKYIGAVIIVPAAWTLVRNGGRAPMWWVRRAVPFGTAAGAIFLLVQFPALLDLKSWFEGFRYEVRHGVAGHILYLDPLNTRMIFHLSRALVPGIGLLPLLLAGAALVWLIRAWRSRPFSLRLIAVFAVAWYVVHEISPNKPWVGSERYMLPLAPVISILAAQALRVATDYIPSPPRIFLATASASLVLAATLWISLPRVTLRPPDSQVVAAQVVDELPGRVIAEAYTIIVGHRYLEVVSEDAQAEIRSGRADFAVVSSLVYRRYLYGERLARQHPSIARKARLYRAVLGRPHVVLRSEISFGLHGATIRIVPLHDRAKEALNNPAVRRVLEGADGLHFDWDESGP